MVAVIKTFKIGGLVRARDIWTNNLHTARISANDRAEAPLFGRSREGTGLNKSGISMAGSDICVPPMGTRQWL